MPESLEVKFSCNVTNPPHNCQFKRSLKINKGIMKKSTFAFLVAIFTAPFFAYPLGPEYKTHFNISNYTLEILKIDDNRLILFGSKGGIIRSSDAGETWKQNFSGTHANILKLINHNDRVYGVNANNQIMVSEDFGDLWKLYSLNGIGDEELSDLETLDDFFIVASKSNKIFISPDIKGVWQEVNIPESDSIISIASYQNKLYVQFKDFSVYYSDLAFDNWIELPIENNFLMKKKNNHLFFVKRNSIAELNTNNEIKYYDISTNISGAYPSEDAYYLINESSEINRIEIHKYDKITNQLELLSSSRIPSLHNYYYLFNDLELFGDDLLITNTGKTYLKYYSEQNEVKLLSNLNFIDNPHIQYFYDRNTVVQSSNKGNIRYSRDGGASFKYSDSYYNDTINNFTHSNRLESLIHLGDGKIFGSFGMEVNNKGSSFYSEDYGNNITFLNITELRKVEFIFKKNKYLYFSKIFPSNGNPRNDVRLYRIDMDEFKIDTLLSFEYSTKLGFFKTIGNNIYFTVNRQNTSNYQYRWFDLYKSNLDFSDVQLIKSFDEYNMNHTSDLINYQNESMIIEFNVREEVSDDFVTKYMILDYNDDSIKEFDGNGLSSFQTQFTDLNLSSSFSANDTLLKVEGKLDTNGIAVFPVHLRSILARGRLNDEKTKFEYELLDTLDNTLLMRNSQTGDFVGYFDFNNYWVPIDQEHINMSVDYLENGPPAIWTYSAYPNPVSDKVSVSFYSALIPNINELKVEIINISTGIIDSIPEYEISISDDYHGTVDFDIGGYPPGAYIINLKLRDQSMSETVIKQ